jgi:hypothetical protein
MGQGKKEEPAGKFQVLPQVLMVLLDQDGPVNFSADSAYKNVCASGSSTGS